MLQIWAGIPPKRPLKMDSFPLKILPVERCLRASEIPLNSRLRIRMWKRPNNQKTRVGTTYFQQLGGIIDMIV